MTLNTCRANNSIMQLRFHENDDFLVFNKPFGVRTHKVEADQHGFVEYLSERLSKKLHVVHRLDRDTSGLILFAKSKESASAMASLFEKQQVKKCYYFLTDQKKIPSQFKIASHIEKQNEFFVNNTNKDINSETEFELIGTQNNYYIWKAFPKTGKPHQIRLHAQLAGIPILGDQQHAGSQFHRLALHSQLIEFNLNNKNYSFSSEHPPFTNIFADCYFSRNQLYQITPNESYRLIHNEYPRLRADIYSDHLWIYNYHEIELEKKLHQEILDFAKQKNLKLTIRHMLNRGSGVGGLEKETLQTEGLNTWTAQEEGVSYVLKTDSGFSPGLFLDQRENRIWLKSEAKNKKVLNLFSYTGGFSVSAALGGAKEVTTVDVSQKFLNWSKENFILNNLNPDQFEFFSQDTILFLKGSQKRNRKWDLIICDPPSFGRSKDAVWKLESHLPNLAELLIDCLEKNGKILFTCNLEKRSKAEIVKLFSKKIKNKKIQISPMPMLSLDYEVTDDLKNLMKGFIVAKL